MRAACNHWGGRMGIYERDYMRGDDGGDWWKPGYWLKRWLTIALIAVSLLTSIVYLARSAGVRTSVRDELFAKRSLKVNINSATQEELETLPGVGPARAQAIMAKRPYKNIDELKKVSGIGSKMWEDLRPVVKIDGETERLRPR